MRFDFKLEPLMIPILFPFGAKEDTCFAELDGGRLHIKMGSLFDETFDTANIAAASQDKWSLLGGMGVRIGFNHSVAVLASISNVVKLEFKEPEMLKVFGPIHHKTEALYLSFKDPEAFLTALKK